MESLMQRYNLNEQEIIKLFFDKCAKATRKNGKMSDNVKKKQLEKWQKYSTKAVVEGLKIYNNLKNITTQNEKYAIGIIRNNDKELKENAKNFRDNKRKTEGERIVELAKQYDISGEDIKCDF